MSGLFRKNALVVSIFCALLEMGVSPTIVYASGMALEYEASQGDIVGNKYSITEPISSVVYYVFAAWHNGGGNVSENTLSVEKVLNWDTSKYIPPMLVAGYTELGVASTNVLNVENTDIYDTIGGANKKGGSAINNQVYM